MLQVLRREEKVKRRVNRQKNSNTAEHNQGPFQVMEITVRLVSEAVRFAQATSNCPGAVLKQAAHLQNPPSHTPFHPPCPFHQFHRYFSKAIQHFLLSTAVEINQLYLLKLSLVFSTRF